MRRAAATALLVLLSACAEARSFARSGRAGPEPLVVALALDVADPQPTVGGPFCDPVFGVCPDRAPTP